MKVQIDRTDRKVFITAGREHLTQEAPIWEGVTDDGRHVQCLVILVSSDAVLTDLPGVLAVIQDAI